MSGSGNSPFEGRTRIRTLAANQDSVLRDVVSTVASARGATNVFNPSVVSLANDVLITVRGEGFPGERPFRSWFIHARTSGEVLDVIDLTEVAREHGVPVVADPKLVRLGDDVFVTFNTGYVADGPNAIFLQRVYPAMGPPQECRLSERQRIEKNWAFFLDERGELAALYGIAPVKIIVRRSGTVGGTAPLEFVHPLSEGPTPVSDNYTIGTQIHASEDGEMRLVIHQKHRLFHKRAYTGRLARLTWDGEPAVALSSIRLIHSYAATIPQLRPHNRRLISATYFSGISSDEHGGLLMSYGINDRTFGIARTHESDVWATGGSLR